MGASTVPPLDPEDDDARLRKVGLELEPPPATSEARFAQATKARIAIKEQLLQERLDNFKNQCLRLFI